MTETKNKLRILIVEDEEPILNGLTDLFVYHGYEVDSERDGKEGLEKALNGTYDMILLDVMLPSLDGFSICNQIRAVSLEQPIIMLTAKTTEEDIITGLSQGADDYIAKPFSVRELVLRVEAVLRRNKKINRELAELKIGDQLVIDTRNLLGQINGSNQENTREIAFTRREIEILQYLQENNERPVSREELLDKVWGYARASQIETRTVDIHIAKLRRKLEQNPKEPTLLATIRGEGYRLLS